MVEGNDFNRKIKIKKSGDMHKDMHFIQKLTKLEYFFKCIGVLLIYCFY